MIAHDFTGSLPVHAQPLTCYSDEFAKQRMARINNLRRTGPFAFYSPARGPSKLLTNTPQVTMDEVDRILHSNDNSLILQFASRLEKNPADFTMVTDEITKSELFVDSIMDILNGTDCEDIKVALYHTISMLFPLSPSLHEYYIDSGICLSILDSLTSPFSRDLYFACLTLVSSLAYESYYARDSLICTGIHDVIAELAKSSDSPDFIVYCCCTLDKILEDLKDIARECVFSFIPDLISLLQIPNNDANFQILHILLMIVREFPSTVLIMFDNGISQLIPRFLSQEDLAEITLKLLGNLCHAKPSDVLNLYHSGLGISLHNLMIPKFITEVLWVMSNLVEVIRDVIFTEITPDFIQEILNDVNNCNFNCKLEAAYFMSTSIMFCPQTMIKMFITQEIIDLVVDILGCGVHNVVCRSANAIARLIHFAQMTGEFNPLISYFTVCDLTGRLHDLLEDDSVSVWWDNAVSLTEFYTIVSNMLQSNE
ncbi:hypothetical protein TRFO_04729 [Tritrichomonas foetus]|uniref:Uncharacterized protein n=1 Tax=Tritrichomonas foetus TaxID=1144522 RepID=A0A1J4KFW8_9EUKA|nr:hypothetical protein TRFO_04729 [Tritrichomonas foetus]|eukprot:OHT08676.1 hypothetical protein TRFO_04729 [Tritrichomonas foetus]